MTFKKSFKKTVGILLILISLLGIFVPIMPFLLFMIAGLAMLGIDRPFDRIKEWYKKLRMNSTPKRKVVIVGAGFGGIRAALDLAKKKIPNLQITLINDKPHFEYTPALYRIVTGKSPLEVCIPLREIFKGKNIDLIEDTIVEVDLNQKQLKDISGSRYSYDYLILALGSETAYFNISGLKEFSFGFKSITQALRLKNHLHDLFKESQLLDTDKEEDVLRLHPIVVGGGASGVEIAAELATYTKQLAKKHLVDPSIVTIDLIEASSRLVPFLPDSVSAKIQNRLQQLEVNIFLNRTVVKEEIESVYLKDMEMKTKTVIWAAGVKPNHLYSQIQGLSLDQKGKVAVDEFLQAKRQDNVFVVGDAAATKYAGMAQTAIHDGRFVADVISKKIAGLMSQPYKPKKPFYAMPLGPGWAAVIIGPLVIYGKVGWWLRRLADLRFFLSILPPLKAFAAFRSGKTLCESCQICLPVDRPLGSIDDDLVSSLEKIKRGSTSP